MMNSQITLDTHDLCEPLAAGRGAKWAYFSLVYSLFYWVSYFSMGLEFASPDMLYASLYYLAFVGCYLFAIHQPRDRVLVPIIGMLVIISASCYVNPGASGLYGYVAFMVGFYYRLPAALGFLALNFAVQLVTVFTLSLYSPFFWVTSGVVSIILFVFGRFNRRDVRAHLVELRQDQEIENLAAIAERERIARDMHDLLGHSLSSIALKSELAEKLIDRGDQDQARREINQVAELSRQVLSEVRMAVTGLKQQGLPGVMENLAKQLMEQGYSVEQDITSLVLRPTVESALILVTKEAVTNILKHSNGNKVVMSLAEDKAILGLEIFDNGTTAEKQASDGNGLEGIQSRVAELGGEVTISRDNGFRIKIAIPVHIALGEQS
jgi:two-component system sensor histidine kinase DesK